MAIPLTIEGGITIQGGITIEVGNVIPITYIVTISGLNITTLSGNALITL
jgi:hypothetical protein